MGIKDIGLKIKTARLSRNMTQRQLAEKVGVSASTITMYERGQRVPNDDIKEALADVFNISISELYGNDEERTQNTPLENQLIVNYRKMTDQAQVVLLDISEHLVKLAPRETPAVESESVPDPAGPNMSDEWIDGEFDDMNMDEAAITDIDHTSHYMMESDNDNFDPA